MLNVLCFDIEWIYICHTSGFYGKWSLYKIGITFSYLCVRYHKKHNGYVKIHTLFWHKAKVYLMCIKLPWWLITQIWYTAKLAFTCISNTWYLITVPNMNKINPFISEISQQIHKVYEKWSQLLKFGIEPNAIL